MAGSFKNITEVKRANKAAGYHWFSVRDSRRVSKLIDGNYWVESNAPFQEGGERRIFAVAAFPDGEVQYLNGADTFPSIADALAYIANIVRAWQ